MVCGLIELESDMKQITGLPPKRRSETAHALADNRYRLRIVRDRKKYTRKGRAASTRTIEGFIQLAIIVN